MRLTKGSATGRLAALAARLWLGTFSASFSFDTRETLPTSIRNHWRYWHVQGHAALVEQWYPDLADRPHETDSIACQDPSLRTPPRRCHLHYLHRFGYHMCPASCLRAMQISPAHGSTGIGRHSPTHYGLDFETYCVGYVVSRKVRPSSSEPGMDPSATRSGSRTQLITA